MKKILKKIYFAIPFKKYFFLKLKKFFKPPEEIYKHLRFKEPFLVEIDSKHSFYIYNDSIVENEIFWNGFGKSWENISLDIWSRLSKESEIILDIGANNGIYALVASAMNNEAKTFAFEPNSLYTPSLKNNININKYQNRLFPIELAVGETTGICEIDDYSEAGKKIKCEAISIDEYVDKVNLQKIDLIKIDVESYEPYVIKGSLNSIEKYKPSILIEILSDKIADELYQILCKFDYIFFNIDENRGIRKVAKLSKSDSFNFLLCTEEVAQKLKII